MHRHTIAQTGVSIKSQGHIDLEEEGEGERKGRRREKRRKRKLGKEGGGKWVRDKGWRC